MEDGLGGFRRAEAGGGQDVTCEAEIEGVAALEASLGFKGRGEDGTDVIGGGDGLEHATIEEDGKGGLEVEDHSAGSLLEQEPICKLLGGASAEGQDRACPGEGVGEGRGFHAAEMSFAVAGEELGNGGAGAGFDVLIEVEEVPAQGSGEQPADGGFAGSHKADEDDTFERDRKGGGLGWSLGGSLGGECGWGGGDHHGSLLWWGDKQKPRPLGSRLGGGECSFVVAKRCTSCLSRRGANSC